MAQNTNKEVKTARYFYVEIQLFINDHEYFQEIVDFNCENLHFHKNYGLFRLDYDAYEFRIESVGFNKHLRLLSNGILKSV